MVRTTLGAHPFSIAQRQRLVLPALDHQRLVFAAESSRELVDLYCHKPTIRRAKDRRARFHRNRDGGSCLFGP